MGFNQNTPRAEYIAAQGQSAFPFAFKIYNSSDLVVYKTSAGQISNDDTDKLVLNGQYSVTIDEDEGGQINLVTPLNIGDKVTIIRDLPNTREVEYQTNGQLLATTLNQDQDYQTYLLADMAENFSRTVSMQESTQNVNLKLPAPNSDQYIRWNSTADALINDETYPAAIQTAVDAADDAQEDRDAVQILHDNVVAKEALVNPYYGDIDIIASDLNGYYVINSTDNGFISEALDAPVDVTESHIATVSENIQAVIDSYANAITATTAASNASTSETNAALSASSALSAESSISPYYSDITSAVSNASNITTVAGNIANVNNVGNNIANVNTVSTDISNVNTVAVNITNVNAVANSIDNLDDVANNAINVNTVAGSIDNVNTVAGSIINVNNVGGNISNVNQLASDTIAINEIYTNRAEIYEADTNAAIATAQAAIATSQASTATAQAAIATTKASEASASEVNAEASAITATAAEAQTLIYRDSTEDMFNVVSTNLHSGEYISNDNTTSEDFGDLIIVGHFAIEDNVGERTDLALSSGTIDCGDV